MSMTHLYIEQNTGLTEEVNSSIISKLYELASSEDLDQTSDLKGRLHSSTAKDIHVTYLTTNFENLYINADKLYMTFTDPEVERVLMATQHIGDGIGISLADCATYGDYSVYGTPYVIFNQNKTIEYFPEFKYFTYWINKSNTTGLTGSAFDGCTNLKNIDITGLTSIPYDYFSKCSLSEFDPRQLLGITHIGQYAFQNSGISGEINLPALQTTSSNIFNECSNITKVLSLGSITELKNYSFNSCGSLTQVALPTTCTILREKVFNECTNLTTIYEEGSQAVVGSLVLSHISLLENSVFSSTKITSADFTGCTFTSTGSNALSYCSNLTTVVLPNTCTQLGNSIFYNDTSLQSITGLSNLTSISQQAFYNCSSLQNIDIDWNKLTTVQNSAFQGCTNLNVSIDLSNVTTLDHYAFSSSGITSITQLNQNVSLGNNTFNNCTSLTTANNIYKLSNSTFYGCSNLTTVTGLSNITSIPGNAFRNCGSLTSVDIDFQNVTSIESYAFYNCSNLEFNSPLNLSSVTSIGQNTFYNCTKLVIDKFPIAQRYYTQTFTSIGNTTITIPKEVEQMDNQCFGFCTNLTTVLFEPNSQITSMVNTFKHCPNLTGTVDIPEGLTTSSGSFYECYKLKHVIYPSTTTSIGNAEFMYANSLISITVKATTPPTIMNETFSHAPDNLIIYVPAESVSAYQSAQYWSLRSSKIQAIPAS